MEADSAARSAARRESWVVAKVEGWRGGGDIVGCVFVCVLVVVIGGGGGGRRRRCYYCVWGYVCRWVCRCVRMEVCKNGWVGELVGCYL